MFAEIFSHPDFIIINKPAFTTMHASSNSPNAWLLADIDEPYHIVHRLDDQTSGCCILAKTSQAAETFRGLFAANAVHKTYIALSEHKGKRKMGWVKGDMHNIRSGVWALQNSNRHPAVSYFKRTGLGNGLYLFWARPYSGKTHQIRVALKSNSSPILGDTTYKASPADRIYLHATRLQFEYAGEHIDVSCWPTTGEHFIALHQAQQIDLDTTLHALNWPQS